MEDEALVPTKIEVNVTRVSRYRWIVLTIFSIFSLLQSGVWDTWGPISPSATQAIGFTQRVVQIEKVCICWVHASRVVHIRHKFLSDSSFSLSWFSRPFIFRPTPKRNLRYNQLKLDTDDYYLLSNWAPIGIMPTMPIFIWLFNNYGTRIPVVVGSFLVAAGTGLRCIPVPGQSRIITIHMGQFLSSVAGCVVLGAGPLISNTWFPSGERILATSIMICVGNMGNALSYLIGPAIVSAPTNCSNHHNITIPTVAITTVEQTSTSSSVSTLNGASTTACYDNTDKIREQINYYMYGEFALGVATFLAAVFLYRNKPVVPPSPSAAEDRFHILDGLRQLSKNFYFWISAIAFSLVNGAYYGWYGIITILVTPYNVTEAEISQAAFAMTIVGSALGITVGWFSDRLKGRIKWILFTCYCVMFVSFLSLATIVMGWFQIFEFSYGGFITCFIILGSVSNIIQPLGIELTADMAYPVSEGVSTSVVAWLIMFFMFIYLLILNSIPEEDRDVANYLFLAFVGVAAPILAFSTKNENIRVTVDAQQINSDAAIENDMGPDSSASETDIE